MTKRARTTEGSEQQPALFDISYMTFATSTENSFDHYDTDHLQSVSSTSLLENLPPEIRHNILLNSPDLQSLRNLTKASPTFHAQYKRSEQSERSILQATLAREFDGFVADAVATVESGGMCSNSKQDSVTNVDIRNFFIDYKSDLENEDSLELFDGMSLECTKYLLRYHLTTIVPLSEELAKQAMTNFANSIPNDTPSLDKSLATGIQLSLKEKQRLMQALYRLETYYNLFGSRIHRCEFARASFVTKEVLPLFKPWGIEAMACIQVLAKEFLQSTVEQAYEDQFRNSEKCSLLNAAERDSFVYGIIPLGVQTMALFYKARSDPTLLYPAISEHASMEDNLDPQFLSMLRYAETVTGDEAVLPRDVRYSDQAPFGMSEVSWSRSDVIIGDWVPKAFRSWGYAIWDSHRWTEIEQRLGFLGTVWIDEARERNRLRSLA